MKHESRIWELDALRGILILLVIVIHAVFDVQYFILRDLSPIPGFSIIQNNTGEAFILLSGLCATLGSRPFRRGLIVFSCGMLITLVTYGMYRLGFAGRDIIIYFGILHLLGLCMMLYPLYKKLPNAGLVGIGLLIVIFGYRFSYLTTTNPYLFVLGITTKSFSSGDYFPLFPHLGWYFIGVFLGKTVYKVRKTRFPNFPAENKIVRFFQFCGRHSLWIYLIHQPILYFFVMLLRN